jgi:hypothetical protein
MKKLTFSKLLFLIFEVKYIKNFSLEHKHKSAGEVSIVENYGKICLVGQKIVCGPHATMVKKKRQNFGKIVSNTVLNYF